jgi:FkbM family methyltransferase
MANLKSFILTIPILGSFIQIIYWSIYRKYLSPEYWITKLAPPDASIVQIGSNDGKQGDPLQTAKIYSKNWKALFVEPVPYLFKRLKSNYGNNSNYSFANNAINDGCSMKFYSVEPKARDTLRHLPPTFDQLGSFDKDHIIKGLGQEISPFIIETEVNGISLDTLLDDYSIKKIDILHIDTEGYDWKILSQLNRSKYKPVIILYEYIHLSDQEKRESLRALSEKYFLYKIKWDILAIRKSKTSHWRHPRWRLRSMKVDT